MCLHPVENAHSSLGADRRRSITSQQCVVRKTAQHLEKTQLDRAGLYKSGIVDVYIVATDMATWTVTDGGISTQHLGTRNGRPTVFILKAHSGKMKYKFFTKIILGFRFQVQR